MNNYGSYCEKCGERISGDGKYCPCCGAERRPAGNSRAYSSKSRKSSSATVISVICAIIAVVSVVILLTTMNKQSNSNSNSNNNSYSNSSTAVGGTTGYQNSTVQTGTVQNNTVQTDITTAEDDTADSYPRVGDTILYGVYEQDNDPSNGREPIEWIVLDKQGEDLLLISKYALDGQKYHHSKDPEWETSTLRSWLNNDFLKEAFFEDEEDAILYTTVSGNTSQVYSPNAGKTIQDKIFLLSVEEAEKYFKTLNSAKCAATEYAIRFGATKSKQDTTPEGEPTCWWWLRGSSDDSVYAVYVRQDGSICDNGGISVYSSRGAVRPAMWLGG